MKLYEEFHNNTRYQTRVINENNFTYLTLLNTVNKYLVKSRNVLDIGCGAGTLSLYFAEQGKNVHGIDISKRAIKEATESAKKLNLSNVKFKTSNFPKDKLDGKYDLITCFEVLEHLDNDNKALEVMTSALKDNGIIILSVPSINAPLYRIGYAKGFDKRVGHLRRYSLEDMKILLNKVNLNIVEYKLHEGVVRNFLFLNAVAGNIIRVINKFGLGNVFTSFDNLFVRFFGESDIIIVAQKK